MNDLANIRTAPSHYPLPSLWPFLLCCYVQALSLGIYATWHQVWMILHWFRPFWILFVPLLILLKTMGMLAWREHCSIRKRKSRGMFATKQGGFRLGEFNQFTTSQTWIPGWVWRPLSLWCLGCSCWYLHALVFLLFFFSGVYCALKHIINIYCNLYIHLLHVWYHIYIQLHVHIVTSVYYHVVVW